MVAFYVLILTIFSLFAPAYGADSDGYAVGVKRVIAGDTIEAEHNGKLEKIKLTGIDSPERDQPFGKQAIQVTSSLCLDKTVIVEAQSTDDSGRIVANVLLLSGDSLSEELLALGCSWYRQAVGGSSLLRQLEATARAENLGLWQEANPIAPWEWRRNHTTSKLMPRE
jgi:endonuclease YncB( thermonuclease family)